MRFEFGFAADDGYIGVLFAAVKAGSLGQWDSLLRINKYHTWQPQREKNLGGPLCCRALNLIVYAHAVSYLIQL